MHNWFAEPPQTWLAPSDLKLVVEGEQKGAGGSASLRALWGRVNRVQLGVPQTTDVIATWPSNEMLESEVAATGDRFNFYYVRIACSFIPDRGCQFIHARLEVMLSNAAAGSLDAPIVLDLFPREVSVKRAFSRSFGLNGGVKFSFLELSGKAAQKEEAVQYEPALIGAGLVTDLPSWTFDATGSNGLAGIRELFLLIKKAKNCDITAQFRLGAEVQTAWGLRRYSSERLLEAAYIIRDVPFVPANPTAPLGRHKPRRNTLQQAESQPEEEYPSRITNAIRTGESTNRSIKVFLSYAHEDEALHKEFSAHLGALRSEGIVEVWWDNEIQPGSEWNAEIARELDSADLIILLVSSAFLNSVFCYDKEMRRAVERHEAGVARVVPIIVRDCYWQPAPFAKLQGLPKGMKPITGTVAKIA